MRLLQQRIRPVPGVAAATVRQWRRLALRGLAVNISGRMVWEMGAKRKLSPEREAKPRIGGGAIVAKPYPLLEDCIEGGLKAGIRKVFKYWPTPAIKEDQLLSDRNVELILNYIMVDICERFDFEDTNREDV